MSPRWDLVYKWADAESRSLADAVTSALENCDRKLEAVLAAPAEPRIDVERLAEALRRTGIAETFDGHPWLPESLQRIVGDIAAEYARLGAGREEAELLPHEVEAVERIGRTLAEGANQ